MNKHSVRKWMRNILLSAVAAACLPAFATVLTIDFNSGGGQFRYAPYYEDGFRVYSVPTQSQYDPDLYTQVHYDMTCFPSWDPYSCGQGAWYYPEYDGSVYLGSDYGTCRYLDAAGNPVEDVYCGQAQPRIRIDRFGSPFSVLAFQAFSAGLISSTGGYERGSSFDWITTAGDDLWRDVEWVELAIPWGTGAIVGIDNLRVQFNQAPEPSSLVLLGLGLATLAFTRRRKH